MLEYLETQELNLLIRNDCENDKEFSVTNYIPFALLARSC